MRAARIGGSLEKGFNAMAEKKGGKPQGEASPAGTAVEAKIEKKLNPKTFFLGSEVEIVDFAPGKDEPEAVKEFAHIYGVGSGFKTGHSQYGDWTAITGQFEGVSLITGRRYISGTCFIPGAAGDMLIGGLRTAKVSDPDASATFGLALGVKYLRRQDGTHGYEYTARKILDIKAADPLAELRAAMPAPELLTLDK